MCRGCNRAPSLVTSRLSAPSSFAFISAWRFSDALSASVNAASFLPAATTSTCSFSTCCTSRASRFRVSDNFNLTAAGASSAVGLPLGSSTLGFVSRRTCEFPSATEVSTLVCGCAAAGGADASFRGKAETGGEGSCCCSEPNGKDVEAGTSFAGASICGVSPAELPSSLAPSGGERTMGSSARWAGSGIETGTVGTIGREREDGALSRCACIDGTVGGFDGSMASLNACDDTMPDSGLRWVRWAASPSGVPPGFGSVGSPGDRRPP